MSVKLVRGMRDLIGKDALLQKNIENKIENVFEKYGYTPVYTPAVENFELFKIKGGAGELIKDEIYYFKDKSERELGLRFEFTASLARIAANSQLKLPFKRYQIGEVYRYDRPGAKRYRAFNQADIDILGIKGLSAEIEIMLIIKDCFEKLNLKPRVIFNSRVLLNEIIEKYSTGKEKEVMRILDKMDKIGSKETKKELAKINVKDDLIDLLKENNIKKISKILGSSSKGIEEINIFSDMCKENQIDFVEFSSTLARGFDYYTGIVFEIKLDDGPSVGGGGRFDKLIETYGGLSTPAVGMGLGVSRIFDYLKEKNEKTKINGLYLIGLKISQNKIINIAQQLRKQGLICEIDLEGKKSISKNFEYAEKKGYRCVGIIGEDEIQNNKISIKNLLNGMQFKMDLDIKKIKELFEN